TNEEWGEVESLPHYGEISTRYRRKGYKYIIGDPILESMLDLMLVYDPLNRASAEEVLDHIFFEGLPPIVK
ncbi:hypothetical protein PAEPH01_2403, partial [Pancytospora epiphaga]